MSSLSQFKGGDILYWVSGATYSQGKVVRSPTDHQLYVRVIAGSGTTDPASDSTNWRPDGGRPIKSIQRGVATAAGTVTISAVNLSKAFMSVNVQTGTVSAPVDYAANSGCAYLSSSTQVTVVGAGANQRVCWEVIEFY